MIDDQYLPAGDFATWLRRARSDLITGNGVEVPCGECNACCRSSYFIHIQPRETQTLSRINKRILFPAPGLPKGNVLLGYDTQGHCPMLHDNKCSIYQDRPRVCRAYDCRIFAAAGIVAGGDDKALINQRVHRWRFSYQSQHDHDEHNAVLAAATFLQEHATLFPDGFVPSNASQLAILAIIAYEVFLDETQRSAPMSEIAKAIIHAQTQFEAQRKTEKRS